MKLPRLSIKKLMLLVLVLGVSFCFLEVRQTGSHPTSYWIRFQPGVEFWWNSISPGGEQSGFAITKSDGRLFQIEEWNGSIGINFRRHSSLFEDQFGDVIWIYKGKKPVVTRTFPPEENLK